MTVSMGSSLAINRGLDYSCLVENSVGSLGRNATC